MKRNIFSCGASFDGIATRALLMHESLNANLREIEKAHRWRRRRVVSSPCGPEITVDGHPLLSFCSNDYLGLANHPDVVLALQEGAARFGVGSGGAHLVSGHHDVHHALEDDLAAFTGRERALLFSTGYMANLGIIGALTTRSECIAEDKLNHASLIDGALLSRARLLRYRHADTDHLATLFANRKPAMVVTDGVFSMDGDIAPLPHLAALCRQNQTTLMVDDAHGIGVLGANGGGSLERFQLTCDDVPILMGTLGKALGTFGAFVAGSNALIETLIQQARTYIYTTAMPPAIAHATRVSLRIAQQESWRRQHLTALIERFRSGIASLGLQPTPSETPIQPLIIGDSARALALSSKLEERGIWVPAIRPPTVPNGSARLRVTLSAAHDSDHVDQLITALTECL